MKRIWCWFVGHRWEGTRCYIPKAVALMHLHPLAGCDATCLRCGAVWLDFPEDRPMKIVNGPDDYAMTQENRDHE